MKSIAYGIVLELGEGSVTERRSWESQHGLTVFHSFFVAVVEERSSSATDVRSSSDLFRNEPSTGRRSSTPSVSNEAAEPWPSEFVSK